MAHQLPKRLVSVGELTQLQLSGLFDLLVSSGQSLPTAYLLQIALDPIARFYQHLNFLMNSQQRAVVEGRKTQREHVAECAILEKMPGIEVTPVPAVYLDRTFYASFIELMQQRPEVDYYQFDWLLHGLRDHLGNPFNDLQFIAKAPDARDSGEQASEGDAGVVRAPSGLEAGPDSVGEGSSERACVTTDQVVDTEDGAAALKSEQCEPSGSDYEVAIGGDRSELQPSSQ